LIKNAEWRYVDVANQPLAICPICQTVARALQIADAKPDHPKATAKAQWTADAKPEHPEVTTKAQRTAVEQWDQEGK
jgi:hypothetical protein